MESHATNLLPDASIPPGRRAAGQLTSPYPTCTAQTSTHIILSLDVCPFLKQQPHHLKVPLRRCHMQSRVSTLLPDATIPPRRRAAGQIQTPYPTYTARTALTLSLASMSAPSSSSSPTTPRCPPSDAACRAVCPFYSQMHQYPQEEEQQVSYHHRTQHAERG
jgi:hypothetical protein